MSKILFQINCIKVFCILKVRKRIFSLKTMYNITFLMTEDINKKKITGINL